MRYIVGSGDDGVAEALEMEAVIVIVTVIGGGGEERGSWWCNW